MCNFLTGINYSSSIIAVSETWVSDNEIKSLYNIPGYNLVCKGRDSRRGGGVGLNLKDGMNYSVRNGFENTQNCESLFTEVKHAYEKNTIVGVISRPPDGNVGDFNDELQVILDRISREGKWGFLAGDFNIDLLSHVSSSFKDNFENLLSSHCFYPTITYPTRVTDSTTTLIDNVFTNHYNLKLKSSIFETDISDHYPICVYCGETSVAVQTGADYDIFKNDTKTPNLLKFKNEIASYDWAEVYSERDPNSAFTTFHS
ncbi:hypothetical protein HOLleu_26789 [Holothuria leucospilota]|uniref:Endonuclease/exonuclease/phosphatase domain-containing protein n=1 Tax=Holothuria leucospilota TaxID=206669 RepID=A0A9Q1BPU6_HOLLE|nr:hypothetical protein HOLleu_26789 [Holothuria leucospilota]